MFGPGVSTRPRATTAMPRPAPALIMPAPLPARNQLLERMRPGSHLCPQVPGRPGAAVEAAEGGDVAVAAPAPPEGLEPPGQLHKSTVTSLRNSPSHGTEVGRGRELLDAPLWNRVE